MILAQKGEFMHINNSNIKTRIDGPDILRGFAATAVIIVHLIAFSGLAFSSTISRIGSNFTAFVTLFFTISAFSIAYSYRDNIFAKEQFMEFYIKRFFRLAPLFYLAMITEGIIVYILYNHISTILEIILSLSFLFTFAPGLQDSLVWAGWSLGIEWIFYLFYPFMFCLLRNKTIFFILWISCYIISTKIGSLQAPNASIYFNFLTHSIFFVCGIGTYLMMDILEKIKVKIGKHAPSISGILVIAIFLYLLTYFNNMENKMNIYFTYSIAWFIMLSLSIIGMPNILNNKFTRFLGKASYSIYLTHSIIILFLKNSGFYQWINTLIKNPKLLFLIATFSTILFAILISYLTYNFVELPGMKIGKNFISRIKTSKQI